MYFEIDFFMRVVRNQNQGYVSCKCIPWKVFKQVGIGSYTLPSHVFSYNGWNRYSFRGVFRTLSDIYDWDFLRK